MPYPRDSGTQHPGATDYTRLGTPNQLASKPDDAMLSVNDLPPLEESGSREDH